GCQTQNLRYQEHRCPLQGSASSSRPHLQSLESTLYPICEPAELNNVSDLALLHGNLKAWLFRGSARCNAESAGRQQYSDRANEDNNGEKKLRRGTSTLCLYHGLQLTRPLTPPR